MPFGEALSALKREGFTFDAEQTTSGVIFAFRDDSTHALSFCNGRLTSYRYSVAGGMNGFVRSIQNTTTAHGPGNYRASATQTDRGDLNILEFVWHTGPDTLKITYAVATLKQRAESVSVLEQVESGCEGK
jgi:hypothetical protein